MAGFDTRRSSDDGIGLSLRLPSLGGNGRPERSSFAVPLEEHGSAAVVLPKIGGDNWAFWRQYLHGRPQPPALGRLLPDRISPLLWGLDDAQLGQLDTRLIGQLHMLGTGKALSGAAAEKRIAAWLRRQTPTTPSVPQALESLAWAHSLAALAADCRPERWWELFCHICQLARTPRKTAVGPDLLVDQLLGAELPLVLEYQFEALAPLRRLGEAARGVLRNGIVNLTDGDGLLAGDQLHRMPALLACWTRCAAVSHRMGKAPWNRSVQSQYAALVRESLRMTGPDGRWLLGTDTAQWSHGMLHSALSLAAGKVLSRVARLVLPRMARDVPSRPAGRESQRLPAPSNCSEWAGVAVMRASWSKSAPALVACFPGNRLDLTLCDGAGVLLSGTWDAQLQLDGRALGATSAWTQTCWHSNRHVDYLELLLQLDRGVKLERHLVLARDDGFLLLLDVVISRKHGRIEYEGRLPLGPSVDLHPAARTHEAFLADRRRRAVLLPLALPEWRGADSPGLLQRHERAALLRQHGEGRALAAALFVLLDRRCQCRSVTWRQLTVAENLRPVRPDTSVGYRVQTARQQWLIYRSLARPGNRSVLGHNLISETLVARFGADGKVEPLIEIE